MFTKIDGSSKESHTRRTRRPEDAGTLWQRVKLGSVGLMAMTSATLMLTAQEPASAAATDSPVGRIVITEDKVGGGDGWVETDLGEKLWIDSACRGRLEAAGVPVLVLEWPEISAIADAPSRSCDELLSSVTHTPASAAATDSPVGRIVITEDKVGGGDGWVETDLGEKLWIDSACRGRLEAAGVPVLVLEWPEISAIADAPSRSCDELLPIQGEVMEQEVQNESGAEVAVSTVPAQQIESAPPIGDQSSGRFVGNVRSLLVQNGESLDLFVEADNLAGNVVSVTVSRGPVNGYPARMWTYHVQASDDSVVFRDLEGSGPLFSTDYFSVATINNSNPHSVHSPASACFEVTGGEALCDTLRGNSNQARSVSSPSESEAPRPVLTYSDPSTGVSATESGLLLVDTVCGAITFDHVDVLILEAAGLAALHPSTAVYADKLAIAGVAALVGCHSYELSSALNELLGSSHDNWDHCWPNCSNFEALVGLINPF